jgi:hypothetical protein
VTGEAHDDLIVKTEGVDAGHTLGLGLGLGQDLSNPLGGIVLLCYDKMHSTKSQTAVDLSFSLKQPKGVRVHGDIF